MDRPILINADINNPIPSQPNHPQDIVNQASDSPRASDSTRHYNLSIQNITSALFGREYLNLNEVILHILFSCTLKSMLALRLVSSEFCQLISKINPNSNVSISPSLSPLMCTAAVSFDFNQIPVTKNLEGKFDFANKEKIEIFIKISVNQLRNNSSRNLNLINQEQLKISIKIEKLNEVNQLQLFFLNQPNAPFNHKIKKIDLSTLKINNDTVASIVALLNIIAQHAKSFPDFTTLIIGDIENKTIFNLPDTYTIDSVTKLSIGKIHFHAIFNLSNMFSNLLELSIGDIGDDKSIFSSSSEPIKFPDSLPHLKNLHIGSILAKVSLKLPKMDRLSSLSIGTISDKAIINFPNSLDKLIDFSIQDIPLKLLPVSFNDDTTLSIECIENTPFINTAKTLSIQNERYISFNLSASLKNLKKLIIEDIQCDAMLTLPSSLQVLDIKNISSGVTITLVESLPNLTNLDIGSLNENTILNIPQVLPKLTNFSIKMIKDNACVALPDTDNHLTFSIDTIQGTPILKPLATLNNLTNFSIGSINKWTFFGGLTLPKSLNNILDLTIKKIGPGCTVTLRGSKNSLTNLNIGVIPSWGFLQLPNSLNNLINLTIEECDDFKLPGNFDSLINLTIKKIRGDYLILPNSLKNLTNLSIGHVVGAAYFKPHSSSDSTSQFNGHHRTYIVLPASLPNLKNLTIGHISHSVTFASNVFHSLTHLTIGIIRSDLRLSNTISHLTNLSIKNITEDATFILPESLNNLTCLNINGHHAILRLPSSTDGLKIFIIESRHDEVTRKLLYEINAKLNSTIDDIQITPITAQNYGKG